MEPSDLNDTVLRLAALAYLGRYTGVSRTHSESDLRIFFTWCANATSHRWRRTGRGLSCGTWTDSITQAH
jgi:hypothetical protein